MSALFVTNKDANNPGKKEQLLPKITTMFELDMK
jgi:hypothetical protein